MIMPNPPPVWDQYYPGGVHQQAADWNASQHNQIYQDPGSHAGPTGPTGPAQIPILGSNSYIQIGQWILNWGSTFVPPSGIKVDFAKPYTDQSTLQIIASYADQSSRNATPIAAEPFTFNPPACPSCYLYADRRDINAQSYWIRWFAIGY